MGKETVSPSGTAARCSVTEGLGPPPLAFGVFPLLIGMGMGAACDSRRWVGRLRRKRESTQATIGFGLRTFSMRRRKKIPTASETMLAPHPPSQGEPDPV